MANLKHCPFCGGEAIMETCDARGIYAVRSQWQVRAENIHYRVLCRKCGTRTKAYLTKKGAFNSWNRRDWDFSKRIEKEDNNG